ncbi:hypothetical protein [Pseudomonas sp. UBA1879]|uniref:hypothetical protein n=1 Tax=Pseudomonas sp. UBA1879 TaxID=1947305 RepID=UPI0025CDADF5|nr:hypothetical protein [Pseudomonas sp. UBA1879]
MADDTTPDGQSPDPEAPSPKLSGTANLIKNVSDYLEIEAEYDSAVASGLMRKSLQENGTNMTTGEVQAWADINQAILGSSVNVGKTHEEAKAKTDALVNQMIGTASSSTPETASTTSNPSADNQPNPATESSQSHHPEPPLNDLDDDYEDDEMMDEPEDEPEYDTVQDIFNTEDEEDAQEQALDYILKLSERVD